MDRLTTRNIAGVAVYKQSYECERCGESIWRLPIAIGSDVYYIPSKVNYDINVLSKHEENNKVYHQKVANITFTERGWYLVCEKNLEYGVDQIFVDKFYKETWFTSSEEAEQALANMQRK